MILAFYFEEEEMKRFQEVMSEDGYYSSVSFSYEMNSEQNEQQFEENATVLEGIWFVLVLT